MLNPIQENIASIVGYAPLTQEEAEVQYPAEVNFTADSKSVPFNGAVRKDKHGVLQLYWMPQSKSFAEEYDSLVGWYCVPTMEEVEEWTFDSVCFTPGEDEVEPDHPDSWLSLLGLL